MQNDEHEQDQKFHLDPWADPIKPKGLPVEKMVTIIAYQQTFNSYHGGIVLADMRKAYGDRPSFVKGSALSTAFNEGERSVYLKILRLLEVKVPEPSIVEVKGA